MSGEFHEFFVFLDFDVQILSLSFSVLYSLLHCNSHAFLPTFYTWRRGKVV